MITTQASIADLIRSYPGGTAVLHRHGLDFCCGAKKSLDDACSAKGIDSTLVLQELLRSERDGMGTPLHLELWDVPFLVRYIVTNHHAYLRQLIPTLTEQVQKVVSKHGERYKEIHGIADLLTAMTSSLEKHMIEEELGVFQAVRAGGDLTAYHSAIEQHERDHEAIGHMMSTMRALTNDFTPPDDACNTHRSVYTLLARLINDTMQHVFLENTVLFPMLLSASAAPTPQPNFCDINFISRTEAS